MVTSHSGGGRKGGEKRTNDEGGKVGSDETAARPVVDTGMT